MTIFHENHIWYTCVQKLCTFMSSQHMFLCRISSHTATYSFCQECCCYCHPHILERLLAPPVRERGQLKIKKERENEKSEATAGANCWPFFFSSMHAYTILLVSTYCECTCMDTPTSTSFQHITSRIMCVAYSLTLAA